MNTIFQQHQRWLFRDFNTEIRLSIFFAVEYGEAHSTQSAEIRPRADCASDHELLITNFRLKLKKVGKTTRPWRHDLNQTPCDYTAGVTNRSKDLDLKEWLKNYGWMFIMLYRRWWPKPSQRKGNARRQSGRLTRPEKRKAAEKRSRKPRSKEKIPWRRALQYSCLEKSMDRGAMEGYSPWGRESRILLSNQHKRRMYPTECRVPENSKET